MPLQAHVGSADAQACGILAEALVGHGLVERGRVPETQAGGDDEVCIHLKPPSDDEPGGKRSRMRDLHQRELLGEAAMFPPAVAQATAEGGGR
jgi:hypothetical protein